MTEKQKRFADEYLKDLNATQAAIRAGYSKKTAYSIGFEILKKPEIKSYIERQLDKAHEETIADAKEVMGYLTSVMRGQSEADVVVVEGTGDGYSEAKLIKKPPDEKERLKAAELLGKRYGLFTERMQVEGNTAVTILDDIPSDFND